MAKESDYLKCNMVNIDYTREGAKQALLLCKYGFTATVQDDGYYRFKYLSREEEISPDDSVHVVAEEIKVELDFDEKKFRISGTLTNDKDVFYNGDRAFNFIPTVKELTHLLEDQYGLEIKSNKDD